MVLKNNLKAVRCQKALTQEELADLVRVSRQTIISIERYKYKPSLELGLKLALTLDIKIEALFYFEKN